MMRTIRTGVAIGLLLAVWTLRPAGAAEVELPASADEAVERLEQSNRHGEFVEIEAPGREAGPLHTWVVYPERTDKAPVIIVIHEIFGLTDWIRAVADQLAAEGFIAIAPDLISGMAGEGGNTADLESPTQAVPLVSGLPREQIDRSLNAVYSYAQQLPSASGEVGVVGFCWGGTQSFSFPAAQPEVDAAVVYYGRPPDAEVMKNISAPVLGLYGEADQRVTATVEDAKEQMEAADKAYEVEIYDGAGHGFLRAQEEHDGANLEASRQAWPRTIEFFREHLEQAETGDSE